MKWYENIRFYREQLAMYQADLGRTLGVSAQAISKWELNKAEPDIDCILKMCDLFGISSDELLGRMQQGVPEQPAKDDEIVDMLIGLYPEQVQRVRDFVEGMKAASK